MRRVRGVHPVGAIDPDKRPTEPPCDSLAETRGRGHEVDRRDPDLGCRKVDRPPWRLDHGPEDGAQVVVQSVIGHRWDRG